MKYGALETIWGIEISDLISLKWTFITPRGEKRVMHQNPLPYFEYMDYLIDETPWYVPYDKFS